MTAATVGATADRRGRFAQVSVTVVFFAHGVLFASWTAHIPHVKAHLGIDDGTLGLALLGAPVGSVSAIGLAAWLVPRFGSRPVVGVALIGYCLSGPLVGLAGTVWALFAALLLWGGFMGMLDIAMNTQAIAVEGYRNRPLMNGFHACWSTGAFAGAGLGTLGVALGVTLSEQLLLLGVVLLAGAGWLVVRMLPDAAQPATTAPAKERTRRISPEMMVLGAIAFASMLCEGAAADWSSVYLRDSLHSSAAVAGLGYTAFALAMVVVRALGNRLLDRRPAHVLLPLLSGTAALAITAALLIAAPVAMLVALFVLGLGLGAVVPTAFSAAGRLPGLHPGVGVAGVSGLGWAGFVLGPPAIGQLAGATSLPVALAVVPVLTASIALLTARTRSLRG